MELQDLLKLQSMHLAEKQELAKFPGPNEILSSLVAIAELREFFSEPQIATVVCC